MSLPSRLLGANPSIQVSTLLSGSLSTPSAKGAFAETSFQSIATTTVGSGGASEITFSSIPSTYKHLQVRGMALGTAAATGSMEFQFNSDTGSNYRSHILGSNGTTITGYAVSGPEAYGRFYGYYDNLTSGGYPLVFIMDIYDYASTSKYKTVKTFSGMDKNGNNYGEVFLYSSLWSSTSAISSMRIFVGQNFAQYSSFALYGISGQ